MSVLVTLQTVSDDQCVVVASYVEEKLKLSFAWYTKDAASKLEFAVGVAEAGNVIPVLFGRLLGDYMSGLNSWTTYLKGSGNNARPTGNQDLDDLLKTYVPIRVTTEVVAHEACNRIVKSIVDALAMAEYLA